MVTEKRLTEKDKTAYLAIERFVKENGYPPTVRELCRILGVTSTSSIIFRLKSLKEKGYISYTNGGRRTIRIIKRIDDASTVYADVVEVVRCKDCKHWYEQEGVCLKIYSAGAVSSYAWQFRNPDDYCSYGERKDNDSKS
jgi:repressor LexA